MRLEPLDHLGETGRTVGVTYQLSQNKAGTRFKATFVRLGVEKLACEQAYPHQVKASVIFRNSAQALKEATRERLELLRFIG